MNNLTSRTLTQHIESLQKKEYSAEELTLAYLEKISAQDKKLNAYITLNESAISNAREADVRRAKGESLSAFDGIPYAAKDNISTKGLRTTCASKMLENYRPPYDAHVVEQLWTKGAVLLGKTNLDEFAMGVSTETSYFGTTLNPIDTSFVAGGSSGGSAAAVCAKEAAFALGSDTGGSVRQPAAFCGIVGIRPTYGAISRYGLISFAPSLDQIGPITANVRDSAVVLGALCSHDERDESSVNHPHTDFASDLGKEISGMKIAVLDDIESYGVSKDVSNALNASTALLSSLGAKAEQINLCASKNAYAAYYVTACAEASSNLARFDGVRYGFRSQQYENIDSLYRASRSEGFGEEVKRRILFGAMTLSQEYKNDFYKRACDMRSMISAELNGVLEKYDAILLPTAPTSAYKLGEATKMGFDACIDDFFCTLAALAGLPAISLPYKNAGHMPIGIQLVGKAFSEAKLYRIAYAIEDGFSGGRNNE